MATTVLTMKTGLKYFSYVTSKAEEKLSQCGSAISRDSLYLVSGNFKPNY